MKQIYLDNSATTQVDDSVLNAMLPYFKDEYANAHSLHSQGQSAHNAIEDARQVVAEFFGCHSGEIIFTSGATESNNLAIQGVVKNLLKQNQEIHIITSSIEHASVLEVFKNFEKNKNISVSYAPVSEQGIVDVQKLQKLIQPNTVLISVMYANNEVGSIQPIQEIAQLVEKARKQRQEKDLPLYFHVDAVQAVNYLECNVAELGCDLMSISGHKIYAPKGVGALFVKTDVKIKPIQYGGSQESNLRSGTSNVPCIVGLAKALAIVNQDKKENIQKVKKIKDKIEKELLKFENVRLNGAGENQLPNIINVSFKNAEGESILMLLDMEGIAVSTGSACASGALEPSHVLTAMGVEPQWAHGSIRISLGKYNSEVEVPVLIKALEKTIKKLRDIAP